MAASRRPGVADNEFDPPPVVPVRLRDFDPRDHQRLVVNPFLAVFGLIVLIRGAGWLIESSSPPTSLLMIPPLAMLPQLIHYHCLDCGKTGRYVRRKSHACPSVIARWNDSRPSGILSGREQLSVWCWVLGSVAVLVLLQNWE